MENDGLRLGAIPGATPDKWVARWRQRYPEFRLSVDYFDEAGQLDRIAQGTADVGYLRRREDQPDVDTDRFNRVLLYREDPVVCAAQDHWIAAAEEAVGWAEIEEESFLDPAEMTPGEQPDPHEPLAGAELGRAERIALEVVASGAGLLVLPNSVARMLSRKDVVIRRVEGLPGYDVGLCWLRERDSDLIQEFIGVARGRKPGSGRSAIGSGKDSGEKDSAPKSDARKKGAQQKSAGGRSGAAPTKQGQRGSRRPASSRRPAGSGRGSRPGKGRRR